MVRLVQLACAAALGACSHEALLGAECPAGDPRCAAPPVFPAPPMNGGGDASDRPVMTPDASSAARPDASALPPLAADAALDAADPDASTAGACAPERLLLGAYACRSGGVVGAPLLRGGVAHRVRLRGTLASESTVQLQSTIGCVLALSEDVTLPAGTYDIEVCLAAIEQDRWLSLGFVAGDDVAVWTEAGLSGQACEGCP